MKNKKDNPKVYRIASPHWLSCAGFSVTAYAGRGGDESDDTAYPRNRGNPRAGNRAEETTGGYEPQPLTPDGNMSLVDDITGRSVRRQASLSTDPLPKVATIFTSSLTEHAI